MSDATAGAHTASKPAPTMVVMRERKPKQLEVVKVRSHLGCYYFWLAAFVAVLLIPLMDYGLVSPQTAGWLMICAMALSMTASTVDIGSAMTAVFIALGVAIVGVVFGLEGNGIHVLGPVGQWLRSNAPNYDSNFGKWIGIGLFGGLFAFSQVKAYFNGRWRFRRNGFEHAVLFSRGRVAPRAGRTVSIDYPDLLKFVVGFGAGRIRIGIGAGGRDVEETIEHVPFLWFKETRINKILESTSVSEEAEADEVATHSA